LAVARAVLDEAGVALREVPMTDAELVEFMGATDMPAEKIAQHIAGMKPEFRATLERMKQVEIEANLWAAGLGPKPAGVIVCREHRHRKRR
jgi:hypothetical protein